MNLRVLLKPHITQRVVKILDAKYKKADLDAVVANNCKYLIVPDQEK